MAKNNNQAKDYNLATNPDPTLAKFEDEIKDLEKQIEPLGQEWQEIVDKALADPSSLTAEDRKRKVELEEEINPLREQLEEKRSEAREAGKSIRSAAGKPAWPEQGE